uniref:CUB domain-containing protein n=1 Tax=Heterorhabditis bacteriophora TaxID=37862 RepID=A0A1I7X9N0_HETBA
MKSPLHKGFTMKYRIVEPDRKCGGHITNVRKDWEFSGVIESPNWGGFYPPNMDCTWMIDGIVCEKTLRGNGTIQTWNYPSGGRAGKCRYIIKAEPTQAIRIKFKTIGLRVASTSQCFFNRDNLLESADYVEACSNFTGGRPDDKQLNQRYICARYPFVEEGEFIMSGNRPLIIEYASSGHPNNKGILLEFLTMDVDYKITIFRFCGGLIPPPLLSTSYKMVVVFNSDRSVAGKGFSARFEAVDSSIDCDRTFTAPSGEIVFNGSLGRFAQCDFHISVNFDNKCLIKMRNGISEQSPGFPTLRGDSEVCDEYPMDVLRSHGSRVLITLRTTDSSKTFFIMSYEQVISRNRVRFSLVNLDDLKSSDDSGFCGLFASNRLDLLFLYSFTRIKIKVILCYFVKVKIFDGPHNDARLMYPVLSTKSYSVNWDIFVIFIFSLIIILFTLPSNQKIKNKITFGLRGEL